MIKTINVKDGETDGLYKYLSSSITPRPIALVSTINQNGDKNLSPFSFFNVFSINPPILIFSPVKRTKDNTNKDTLENIREIKECVIALVNEEIAHQVALSANEFPSKVNEFEKSGLTEVKSDVINPSLIKESPINFECKVNDIINLGNSGGSGNLILAEILKIHINEKVLNNEGDIDPLKLKIVSRHGGSWYGKTNESSIFKIPKGMSRIGIGIDQLPKDIKNSSILTGSDLAMLASVDSVPKKRTTESKKSSDINEKHTIARNYLLRNEVDKAWQILL